MEAVKSKVTSFVGKRDNIVNTLLLGAFIVLGIRSTKQQQEIEVLEAEKSSLKSKNKAMSSSMWEWRQHLFHLVESDPSSLPISISKLRAIYGEDAPTISDQGLVADADEESTSIA